MKILKKTALIVLVVFSFFMIVLYLFIAIRGKPILVSKLSEATGKKVTIESIGISPLLNIRVKNLYIEPMLKVEHISASPSLIGLCFGKVILNDISVVRPQLIIEKKAGLAAQSKSEGIQEQPQPSPKQQLDLQRFIVKRITARNGRLDFTDYTVGSSSGLKIIVEDINFSLKNTYMFPRSLLADFDLDGRIPWQEGTEEGKIKAEGWLDILKRDIQVTLKIQDIDGIYLYPYYAGWVDLGKARIEKARLNFTSNIQGLNNDVVAQCRLELTDIVRKPRGPDEEESKTERIANAVLDIFRSLNQGKVVVDFTIRTRMDRPEFGFDNIKMAVEDKIAKARKSNALKPEKIVLVPGKILEGVFSIAADLSRAFIDGTVAVGSELKKAVEDSFRKETNSDS